MRSVNMSSNRFYHELEENCKTFLEGGIRLYRGVNTSEQSRGVYQAIDPAQHTRVASGTSSNHYNLLMSHLDSMSDVPPRTMSLIASTDKRTAAIYGTVYLMIPIDGAELGVLWKGDVWYSFGSNDIPYPRQLCTEMTNAGVSDDNWEDFCSDMDDAVASRSLFVSGSCAGFFDEVYSGKKTWVELMEEYFGNEKDLSVIDYCRQSEMQSKVPRGVSIEPMMMDVEMWTDYPCLLLHNSAWPELKSRYGLKNI